MYLHFKCSISKEHSPKRALKPKDLDPKTGTPKTKTSKFLCKNWDSGNLEET